MTPQRKLPAEARMQMFFLRIDFEGSERQAPEAWVGALSELTSAPHVCEQRGYEGGRMGEEQSSTLGSPCCLKLNKRVPRGPKTAVRVIVEKVPLAQHICNHWMKAFHLHASGQRPSSSQLPSHRMGL